MKILILAALPQEYSPLKKLFPSWRPLRNRQPKKFSFNLPGKEIILIESGMGQKAVKEVLRAELAAFPPDLLIFSGFAGGLHPDLPAGSACLVVSTRAISSKVMLHFRFPDELTGFMAENHIRPVLALSAESPGNKQALSALASGQPAVLDMETAMAAEIASHSQIPFICFRAVSDDIDHDLGFDLDDIADEHGRIRLGGVFITLLKKPSTLRAFYLSWRNSRRAAKNLCGSVAAFLRVPAPMLGEMAGKIRVERG